MTTMLRVSDETRDKVMRVAAEDFGGATVEETLRRLLELHWQEKAIAAMDHFRATDPQGWADYLAEAEEMDAASAPPMDPWDE